MEQGKEVGNVERGGILKRRDREGIIEKVTFCKDFQGVNGADYVDTSGEHPKAE